MIEMNTHTEEPPVVVAKENKIKMAMMKTMKIMMRMRRVDKPNRDLEDTNKAKDKVAVLANKEVVETSKNLLSLNLRTNNNKEEAVVVNDLAVVAREMITKVMTRNSNIKRRRDTRRIMTGDTLDLSMLIEPPQDSSYPRVQ